MLRAHSCIVAKHCNYTCTVYIHVQCIYTYAYLEASSLLRTCDVFSLALMYRGFLLLISTSCSLTFFSSNPTSRDHLAASCFLAFSWDSILPRRWLYMDTEMHTYNHTWLYTCTISRKRCVDFAISTLLRLLRLNLSKPLRQLMACMYMPTGWLSLVTSSDIWLFAAKEAVYNAHVLILKVGHPSVCLFGCSVLGLGFFPFFSSSTTTFVSECIYLN